MNKVIFILYALKLVTLKEEEEIITAKNFDKLNA